MKLNVFNQLIVFLQKLEGQEISYSLARHRDEAVMVTVAVPEERWEIEFLSDGTVEVEKFISNGEILGESALSELLSEYREPEYLAVR
ncbi:MAG: hypothetical protein GDA48_23030 [Hormoscilla sp. GM102CHS1]|nr:hypothetical protein [Hormoscilla sp. GM102CHS1]